MPLYEYVCRRCRRQFEELVRGTATVECPACHTTDVQRILSVVSVGRSDASTAPAPMAGPGGCGSCGDPRGPGACALDD